MASSSKKKQRNQKKGKNQTSQKKRDDHDKILITKHLEDNKHLAIASKTEAITTKGIIVQALGKNPENTALQMEVSHFLRELGWKKKQKRINGEPERVWEKVSSSSNQIKREGVTQSQKPKNIDTQALSQPTQASNQINQSEKLNQELGNSTNPSYHIESIIENEANTNSYLPYGEEDVKQVREVLLDAALQIKLQELDPTRIVEDLTGIYEEWENRFGLGLFREACQTLHIQTINKLQESILQIKRIKTVTENIKKNTEDNDRLSLGEI